MRVLDFVGGHDRGTDGRERIECLADHPLAGGHLEIARAHVIENGVAEHVLAPALFGNVAASPADHHGQLRLVIGLGGVLRKHDGMAVPGHRRRKLGEDRGHHGNRHFRFLGVIAVVQADADDLGRPGNRRSQAGRRRVETLAGGRAFDPAQHPVRRIRAARDYRDQIGESGASNPDRLVVKHHSGLGVAFSLKGDESQFQSPKPASGACATLYHVDWEDALARCPGDCQPSAAHGSDSRGCRPRHSGSQFRPRRMLSRPRCKPGQGRHSHFTSTKATSSSANRWPAGASPPFSRRTSRAATARSSSCRRIAPSGARSPRYIGSPNLDEHFRTALLLFTGDEYDQIKSQFPRNPANRKTPEIGAVMDEDWTAVLRNLGTSYQTRLTLDLLGGRGSRAGVFAGMFSSPKLGNFDVAYDPEGSEQVLAGQVANRNDRLYFDVWTSFSARSFRKNPVPRPAALSMRDYRIEATVNPDLSMTAVTRVKVKAAEDDDRHGVRYLPRNGGHRGYRGRACRRSAAARIAAPQPDSRRQQSLSWWCLPSRSAPDRNTNSSFSIPAR